MDRHLSEAKKLQERKRQLIREKTSLPIFSAKERFLKELEENDCLVLVGETGSGTRCL